MRVAPFRAWRFNPARVGPIEEVLAPPEEEITAEVQEQLHRRSSFNVARIVRGKEFRDDSGTEHLDRARATFDKWMHDDVLRRDPAPSIYPYQQRFTGPGGEEVTRLGFIALGEVTELAQGVVRPIERAEAVPKEERVRLMEATRGDFNLAMVLYADPKLRIEGMLNTIVTTPPQIEVEDFARTSVHRLWRVSETSILRTMVELLAPQTVLLAGGRAVYEAALEYRRRHQGKVTLAGTKVMAFFNSAAPGVFAQPVHRIFTKLGSLTPAQFLESATKRFAVSAQVDIAKLSAALAEAPEHSLGFYSRDGAALLTLRTGSGGTPPVLDARLFEEIVFGEILTGDGSAGRTAEDWVRPAPTLEELRAAVDGGSAAAGIIFRPPGLASLWQAVEAGEALPPASVHFAPSLLTGLAINKLDEL